MLCNGNGFNVFDPRNSPAINTHQESYSSGFTASALGTKKSMFGGKKGSESRSLANSMKSFDASFKGAY